MKIVQTLFQKTVICTYKHNYAFHNCVRSFAQKNDAEVENQLSSFRLYS